MINQVLLISFLLLSHAEILIGQQFIKGHYYAFNGERNVGLVQFRRGTFYTVGNKPCHIQFKENEESRSKKLMPDDVSSFVIGADSFTIVTNFKINLISGRFAKDFVQVVDTRTIKLYLHRSSSSYGGSGPPAQTDRYIISTDNKNYLGVWDLKQQMIEVGAFFVKRPDLRAKIFDKNDHTSIEELVKDFNKNYDLK